MPIGISNARLKEASYNKLDEGKGKEFTASTIPNKFPTNPGKKIFKYCLFVLLSFFYVN